MPPKTGGVQGSVVDPNSADISVEMGRSGLLEFGGFVYEERLRQLASSEKRYALYREIGDNHPVAGAVLFTIEQLIRQVDWRIEPPEVPDANSAGLTRYLVSCIDDLERPFKEYVAEFMSFYQYGWDVHEICFKRRAGKQPRALLDVSAPVQVQSRSSSRYDDGLWGWDKFAVRSQSSLYKWLFDETGEALAMVQLAPPDYKLRTIPLTKTLHFATTATAGNPEGVSIFRKAYRPWYFQKIIEEIMAIGIERDLSGLPTLGVPAALLRKSATTAEQTLRGELEKMLRNVRRGEQEGVLYPLEYDSQGHEKYKLALLTTAGRRQFDLQATLEHYDVRIALCALADVMLIGHQNVGSFALADSKTDLMATAIGSGLDTIGDRFNRRAIPQLLEINGMPSDNPPRLTHGDIEHIDITKLGSYILQLAQAGVPLFPDPELEATLRTAGGLPRGVQNL